MIASACSSQTETPTAPQQRETTGSAQAPPTNDRHITVSSGPALDYTVPQPFEQMPVLAEKPAAGAEATTAFIARAEWTAVHAVDGCWYFSGPQGRDTPLAGDAQVVIADTYMRITWGKATFEGTLSGEVFTVTRRATHTFGGAWTVEEAITGRLRQHELVATYAYQECEHGKACPGNCAITANLTLGRVR